MMEMNLEKLGFGFYLLLIKLDIKMSEFHKEDIQEATKQYASTNS